MQGRLNEITLNLTVETDFVSPFACQIGVQVSFIFLKTTLKSAFTHQDQQRSNKHFVKTDFKTVQIHCRQALLKKYCFIIIFINIKFN